MQCVTTDPDSCKRALAIGGGIANFVDGAVTFNGIIHKQKIIVYHQFF